MRHEKIQRITFTALMTAAALVLSYAENLLPTAAFLPPGAKLGLSNVVIMFAASSLGIADVLLIVIAKAFFAFITRGVTAFLMSLAGGLLSAVCLVLIFRKIKSLGYIGTGVASAFCHNAGQLAVSFLLVKSTAVWGYAPIMCIMSVATGILTGLLLRAAMPYLNNIKTVKEINK